MPAPPVPTPAQLLAAGTTRPRRGPGAGAARLVARVLLLLLIAGLGVLLAVGLVEETGTQAVVVGLLLAVVPVPVVVAAIRWVDRHEPEPSTLVLLALAWGAVVAASVSAVANTAGLSVLRAAADEATGAAVTAVVVAPVVEEASKGLGVLLVLWLHRQQFDGVVDGIVFGATVGLGFAVTENVLYYGRAWVEGSATASGVEAVGATFVVRGVFSPFAHPLFTAMTGIGIGLLVTGRSPFVRGAAPVVGYAAAVGLHAAWNFGAVSGMRGFATTYVGFMVPVFLAAAALAAWLARQEGRALTQVLPLYAAAGWLPSYDVAMLSSPTARRRARLWAEQTQGPRAARAMEDYQRAAASLGLLRARVERGAAVPDFPTREATLLREVAAARSGVRPPLR